MIQASHPLQPIVEVRRVFQSFRMGFWMKRAEVLSGVDLSVPRGSIFGFLGANGAGKTTLIQLIVGLRNPTSGQVEVSGHPAVTFEARARIGYLPERPYFHEHLTGEGVLRYFGALSGMSRQEVSQAIPGVLARVGLTGARGTELRRYSKGMLQRIGIAQALIHDPELLVLDEPMSGLDPIGRKEMRELIVRLSAEGHTVFFSTHVIPDVEAICNQVAVIRKGRIMRCGPIRDFLIQKEQRVEVIFGNTRRGWSPRELPGLADLREVPEGWVATVSGGGPAGVAIREILEAQGVIHSVSPVRHSLEEYFSESQEPLAGGEPHERA